MSLASSLVFLSLFASALYFFLLVKKSVPSGQTNLGNKQENTQERHITNNWVQFENKEFGYRISHPPLLIKIEYKNDGGFKDFIRFEETDKSLGKGIGVGVSESSLSEEVKELKEEMAKFEGAKLVKEEKLSLIKYDGFILEYKTQENSQGEDRTIVLIQKDNYTYSISTVPEQIDRAMNSFSFL